MIGEKLFIADKATLDTVKGGFLGSSYVSTLTIGHQTRDVVEVIGRGVLLYVSAITNTHRLAIQIDGGAIMRLDGLTAGNHLSIPLAFDNSLVITSNQTGANAIYRLY